MKFLMIVALAAALPLQTTTASATDAPVAAVAGKIDSGLGELPHYRLWADTSGKNPMGAPVAAEVPGRVVPAAQRTVRVKAPAAPSTDVAALK